MQGGRKVERLWGGRKGGETRGKGGRKADPKNLAFSANGKMGTEVVRQEGERKNGRRRGGRRAGEGERGNEWVTVNRPAEGVRASPREGGPGRSRGFGRAKGGEG